MAELRLDGTHHFDLATGHDPNLSRTWRDHERRQSTFGGTVDQRVLEAQQWVNATYTNVPGYER